MKELFKQHYDSIIKRGLITPFTKDYEFLLKADEELCEWADDYNPNEAIDLICVLLVLIL